MYTSEQFEKLKKETLEWLEKTSTIFEVNSRIKKAERLLNEEYSKELFRTYDDSSRKIEVLEAAGKKEGVE